MRRSFACRTSRACAPTAEVPKAPSCRERLEIRTHHPLDTADARVVIDLVDGDAPAAPDFAKRLQRDLKSDLLPVLEQVGDRFRDVVAASGGARSCDSADRSYACRFSVGFAASASCSCGVNVIRSASAMLRAISSCTSKTSFISRS